jgi:hypothetical protein
MELRSHLRMSFQGVKNWPPSWTSTSGSLTTLPAGEIGVLEQVKASSIDSGTCFIMMSHDGNYYIGRLTFDDQEFCRQVCDLLKNHYGRLLVDIGALDIPYVP